MRLFGILRRRRETGGGVVPGRRAAGSGSARHSDGLRPKIRRFSLPRAKAAESADLDIVAALQRPHHAVEYPFHDDGSFLPSNLLQHFENFFNQIRFRESAHLVLNCVVSESSSSRPHGSSPDPNPGNGEGQSTLWKNGPVAKTFLGMIFSQPICGKVF